MGCTGAELLSVQFPLVGFPVWPYLSGKVEVRLSAGTELLFLSWCYRSLSAGVLAELSQRNRAPVSVLCIGLDDAAGTGVRPLDLWLALSVWLDAGASLSYSDTSLQVEKVFADRFPEPAEGFMGGFVCFIFAAGFLAWAGNRRTGFLQVPLPGWNFGGSRAAFIAESDAGQGCWLAYGVEVCGPGRIPAGDAGDLPAVLPFLMSAGRMVWPVSDAGSVRGESRYGSLYALWLLRSGLFYGCADGRRPGMHFLWRMSAGLSAAGDYIS